MPLVLALVAVLEELFAQMCMSLLAAACLLRSIRSCAAPLLFLLVLRQKRHQMNRTAKTKKALAATAVTSKVIVREELPPVSSL